MSKLKFSEAGLLMTALELTFILQHTDKIQSLINAYTRLLENLGRLFYIRALSDFEVHYVTAKLDYALAYQNQRQITDIQEELIKTADVKLIEQYFLARYKAISIEYIKDRFTKISKRKNAIPASLDKFWQEQRITESNVMSVVQDFGLYNQVQDDLFDLIKSEEQKL